MDTQMDLNDSSLHESAYVESCLMGETSENQELNPDSDLAPDPDLNTSQVNADPSLNRTRSVKPNCPDCEHALKELEKVDVPETIPKDVKYLKTTDRDISNRYGISEFPSLVYSREGYPALYNGIDFGQEEISTWLEAAGSVALKVLYDDSFEHLTQAATGATTGDWLVVFYKESCKHVIPALEGFGIGVRYRINVAVVDVVSNKLLAKRFKIIGCPTTILFRKGKMYKYEPNKYDIKSLASFVDIWYKNVKAERVPVDPTAFDELTENIADYIKDQLHGPNRYTFLCISGTAIFLLIGSLLYCLLKSSSYREKID